MEKLIKIQALIQQIENFALCDQKYKSTFMYEDETTLIIETYCRNWNIAIYQLFAGTPNITMYFEGNSKLKILDLSKYDQK